MAEVRADINGGRARCETRTCFPNCNPAHPRKGKLGCFAPATVFGDTIGAADHLVAKALLLNPGQVLEHRPAQVQRYRHNCAQDLLQAHRGAYHPPLYANNGACCQMQVSGKTRSAARHVVLTKYRWARIFSECKSRAAMSTLLATLPASWR